MKQLRRRRRRRRLGRATATSSTDRYLELISVAEVRRMESESNCRNYIL